MMRYSSKSFLLKTCARQSQRAPSLAQRTFATKDAPRMKSPSEDPHQMADRFVRDSEGRMSGTEALESVPMKVKLRNLALATTLVGFVTGVWWYSMNAVGRADEVSFELEAEEARERALLRNAKEQQQENLVDMEMGVADQEDEVDMTVAVAAPDEIASEEEAKNRALLKKSDRPLWKRVIFFWRI